MRIIEIAPLSNGAHRNQTTSAVIPVPEGWAVIPDTMETPNFPFGEITVENGIVTSWVAGVMPEPEPEPEIIDPQADTDAMMVDLYYKVTLLELEVV